MKRQKISGAHPGRRPAFAVRVILFCLLLLSAAALLAAVGQEAAPGVRVAVVLGNGPRGTDEPTPVQTARCLKAFELYKKGAVNKLVVTGGFTFDYISEARMMKIALVTWSVPPEDVIEEEKAATTIENSLFSAQLFNQRGWTKTALLVSQASHLVRADKIFQGDGFKVQDAPSAEAAAALEDFAQVPDMKPGSAMKTPPTDLIVVYEPYRSVEPMEWPTPALAHRLRSAAALYHAKAASTVVTFNDPYTRSPVNIAQMMKIGLVSLGVPGTNVRAVGRREYRRLADLAAASADKSATVIAPATPKESLDLQSAPKWRPFFVD